MGNRGWGDFGLAAADLIGARKVTGGELKRMAPKNYQLPTKKPRMHEWCVFEDRLA